MPQNCSSTQKPRISTTSNISVFARRPRGVIWLFTAGQVAWDQTGKVIGLNDVRAQTVQTLANVEAVLKEGGAELSDVVKCNVYLKDMKDFQIMNEEFAKLFPEKPTSPNNSTNTNGRARDVSRD